MLILITILLLFLTALVILLLRLFRPDFRYAWLVAVAGAFAAWISLFFWQLDLPLVLALPPWEPAFLFSDTPFFLADGLAWVYAFSLATLGLGTLLTAVARENFPSVPAWAGTLALSGVGILAVLADNPLTLVLTWTAIDLAELITLLVSVQGEKLRERVVISFAMRVIGSGFLLWAGLVSAFAGSALNFVAAPSGAGFYMLIAAGLRLGVLPFHLPFQTETALRQGYGTMLRLISAASSLILLARIPFGSLRSPLIPYLLALVTLAALYSSWMWFRSVNVLDARPYWLLGMGSLALAAALRANPVGSVAWGVALTLGGGALFLASLQNKWLNRLLSFNVLFIAALPFTLTATGWESKVSTWWGFFPLQFLAQAFLLAGYLRYARQADRPPFKMQDRYARFTYPIGMGIFSFVILLLSVWGWQGSFSMGGWLFSPLVVALLFLLIWLRPRIRALNPLQAHWLTPNREENFNRVYGVFWNLYYTLRNLSRQLSTILESDGGILWAFLFVILFASLLAGGIR